jgi:hypothetical protein
MVDKVELGQVFLPELRFFSGSFIAPTLQVHSCSCTFCTVGSALKWHTSVGTLSPRNCPFGGQQICNLNNKIIIEYNNEFLLGCLDFDSARYLVWLFAVQLNAFKPSLQRIWTDHCSSVPDLLYAYAAPVNLPYIPELYPTSYIRNLPRYPRLTFYINYLRALYPTFCYTRCLNPISRPTVALFLLPAVSQKM